MNKKNILELYNAYKNEYKPWRVEIPPNLHIDDLTVLDDEVGGLVFLNENNQDIPHLETIINSLQKSLLFSKEINDEKLYIEVVLNLSIMLAICKLLRK